MKKKNCMKTRQKNNQVQIKLMQKKLLFRMINKNYQNLSNHNYNMNNQQKKNQKKNQKI